ncbi:unnamed protein product [Lactuca saligna]|uniref:Glucose-6-phosphate isomerase n=1 Tax=Lactuca saligna TaxID=75948 RepID=A0AA35ZHT4_LACSI|nr:unnamed protein product [Lactuca saligna]
MLCCAKYQVDWTLDKFGRVIPCDFIGIVKSQQPVYLRDEVVNNHDELMSNFFAQPDALAYGKTPEQLRSENVASHLVPHKTFTGNRPSLSLLLPSLDAYRIGQLLAMYEHRIAVEGFIWDAIDGRPETTLQIMKKAFHMATKHNNQKVSRYGACRNRVSGVVICSNRDGDEIKQKLITLSKE